MRLECHQCVWSRKPNCKRNYFEEKRLGGPRLKDGYVRLWKAKTGKALDEDGIGLPVPK